MKNKIEISLSSPITEAVYIVQFDTDKGIKNVLVIGGKYDMAIKKARKGVEKYVNEILFNSAKIFEISGIINNN